MSVESGFLPLETLHSGGPPATELGRYLSVTLAVDCLQIVSRDGIIGMSLSGCHVNDEWLCRSWGSLRMRKLYRRVMEVLGVECGFRDQGYGLMVSLWWYVAATRPGCVWSALCEAAPLVICKELGILVTGLYVSRNTYIRTGIAEWKISNPVHLVGCPLEEDSAHRSG